MKKVLIVDDERTSLKVLGAIVEKAGYVAIAASSADLALRVLADNPEIALVITDYSMEGLSGRELVVEMRRHEDLVSIPVVMVSGIIKLSEIHDLLNNGVDRFLPKPVDPSELRLYLGQLIK